MPNKKISQLTPKGSALAGTDLLEVSVFNGVTYDTKSLTGANVVSGLQPTLFSGTNIKTINSTSLLGSGDIAISTGLTVGTTAIASGTVGRVLFEGTGNVLQQSANLTFNGTALSVNNGSVIGTMNSNSFVSNDNLTLASTPGSVLIQSQLNSTIRFVHSPLTTANISRYGLAIGFGATYSSALIDVKAAGALSTDIVQRWRNSADSANLAKITGDGAFTVGTYTNGSARMTVSGSTNINFSSEGGFTAGYFQPNQQAATIWGIQALARQNGANIGKGIYTGADGSSVGSTNYGIHSYAYNGTTNYAGYFDAFGGTNNYALVTQRGFSGFNKTDPSAIVDIKAAGALSTDIALRVRNSADTDNIAEFSGNASVYLGLASNRKISINGANNQIMVGNLTTYTGYQHTLALKSYLRPSMIWEDANAVGARTELIYDSYSNTLLRTSLTTNVLNYANPYGSQAKLINVCGATPNITQNGGFFWYRDNSIEVTLPNRVAWLTPEHQFILYNSPSSNYVSNTDSFQLYSNDIVAGNAAPHFRTENGNVIKIYQQTTAVTSATVVSGSGGNVKHDDTFDGYTVEQVVKALRNTGLLA